MLPGQHTVTLPSNAAPRRRHVHPRCPARLLDVDHTPCASCCCCSLRLRRPHEPPRRLGNSWPRKPRRAGGCHPRRAGNQDCRRTWRSSTRAPAQHTAAAPLLASRRPYVYGVVRVTVAQQPGAHAFELRRARCVRHAIPSKGVCQLSGLDHRAALCSAPKEAACDPAANARTPLAACCLRSSMGHSWPALGDSAART